MIAQFDPIQYKITTKANWDTVASDYHYNWAEKQIGPFKSTIELVREADIRPTDKVLELACGTGVIAKKSIQFSNAIFIEMDAENIGFNFKFDKVLCQYALMFFPNVQRVLRSVKQVMKSGASLVLAVHGVPAEVPYFSAIMNPILTYIPDIRVEGTPTVHRFGNPNELQNELLDAGFSNISIKKYNFSYDAGTFEEYWYDYMHSTANSIRTKIDSQSAN